VPDDELLRDGVLADAEMQCLHWHGRGRGRGLDVGKLMAMLERASATKGKQRNKVVGLVYRAITNGLVVRKAQ